MEKTFKFCPNCSSQNISFDFRKFECKDCAMVYYQNVATATAIILRKDDETLFTIRNREPQKGKLDLPGGFTDPNETAEQSCLRELKEELNLDLDASKLNYLMSQPNDYEYKTIPYKTCDLVYEAIYPNDVEMTLEEDEIAAVKWIKIDEINLDEIGFKSLRNAVEYYINLNK